MNKVYYIQIPDFAETSQMFTYMRKYDIDPVTYFSDDKNFKRMAGVSEQDYFKWKLLNLEEQMHEEIKHDNDSMGF